jgi:soluble lytic murein transglycosylase
MASSLILATIAAFASTVHPATVVAIASSHGFPADRATSSFAPPEAIRAVAEGRFFHASLMMRDYLAETPDATAQDVLLAARAEAGWGDWGRVASLLGEVSWLDDVETGIGRRLLGRSLFELGRFARSREELTRYLGIEDGPSAKERGWAELWLGHSARGAEDLDASIAAYERAAALLPAVSDWILLEAASSAADAGKPAAVDALLARIDPEIARERGWRLRVDAFRAADDADGALTAANTAASDLRSSSDRAAALVVMGTLRSDRRDVDGARSAFRRALELSPSNVKLTVLSVDRVLWRTPFGIFKESPGLRTYVSSSSKSMYRRPSKTINNSSELSCRCQS